MACHAIEQDPPFILAYRAPAPHTLCLQPVAAQSPIILPTPTAAIAATTKPSPSQSFAVPAPALPFAPQVRLMLPEALHSLNECLFQTLYGQPGCAVAKESLAVLCSCIPRQPSTRD